MESDLTGKLPLREHLRNIKQVLKVIRGLDRHYLKRVTLKCVLNSVVTYLGLLLSAYILDQLGAGGHFRQCFPVAAISCMVILLLQLAAGMLGSDQEVRWEKVYRMWECITEQKIMGMDFSKIDSPDTRRMRERIWKDNNWGAGINSVNWEMENILSALCRLAGALLVGIPVFTYMVRTKNAGFLLILLIMAAVVALGSILGTYYQKRLQQYMMGEVETDEERVERANLSWDFAMDYGYSYRNGKDVRLYRGYDLVRSWTLERTTGKRERRLRLEASLNSGKSNFFGIFPKGIVECGAYLLVALLALSGLLTVGAVVQFAGCLKNIFDVISELCYQLPQLALAARRQCSTLEFLEISDEMYKGKLPLEKRSDNQYRVEFRDVSFRYPGTEHYALRHFSLELRVGEKLAIVGMNGSGKTTMIKLLCRLYDPEEGEILLNGVDIRKFRHEEYSRLFSVVFQDYQLFSFLLGENVAVAAEYDEAKVRKCLEDAGLGQRLQALSGGLQTYLYKDYEDGVEFSGGEAQKIAIARAIYKTAPFVLLDEPTAALDPLAEYEIYKSFDRIVEDKTAIYISHRLSTCRLCDKIAVFHEGRLIQQGSHEELLQDRTGKYYEMWSSQAQYYVEA